MDRTEQHGELQYRTENTDSANKREREVRMEEQKKVRRAQLQEFASGGQARVVILEVRKKPNFKQNNQ